MPDSTVANLSASDALAGPELFYADGFAAAVAADVKVAATQIAAFVRNTAVAAAIPLLVTVVGVANASAVKLDGTIFTGGTATTTKPTLLIEPAGTTSTAWSTSGTLFGGNAPAGFGGKLIDLQRAGVSKFSIDGNGDVNFPIGGQNLFIGNGGSGTTYWVQSSMRFLDLDPNVGFNLHTDSMPFVLGVGALTAYASTSYVAMRHVPGSAGHLQFGLADVAAPIAQITGVQRVVAGTTNTAGALWTFKDSAGTGTGASGGYVFQVAPAGGSGTTQNVFVDALKIASVGTVLSVVPTGGLGYGVGAGGSVIQITSRSTGVTLNKVTGQITTTADSIAALAIVTFTVTNSVVAATDIIILSKVSGDIDTSCWISAVGAGSFNVSLRNNDAVAADTTAFVFNFAVFKGVTS